MHSFSFSSLLLSFLLATTSTAAALKSSSHPLLRRDPTAGVPTLVPILTAELALGVRFPLVPVPGGQQEAQGQSGPVTGSALNGTIINGIAYPVLTNNLTTAIVSLVIYGETDDKVPFIVTAEGIGASTNQYVWLKFAIGGRYSYLANEFVLGSLSRASNSSTVNVQGFLVQ